MADSIERIIAEMRRVESNPRESHVLAAVVGSWADRLRALSPAGGDWVMVPREPTHAMYAAWTARCEPTGKGIIYRGNWGNWKHNYREMLKAAQDGSLIAARETEDDGAAIMGRLARALAKADPASRLPRTAINWLRDQGIHWKSHCPADPAHDFGEPMTGSGDSDDLPAFLEWIADELVRRDTRPGTFAPGVAQSLKGRAYLLRAANLPKGAALAASPQQEPGAVCSACKGGGEVDGYVDHPSGDPQDAYVATVPCPQCDGSGDAQPAVPAEMVVFQGTTAQLQSAYFGDWSAARAWAGKNGSVTMHTVRMLGIVEDTTAEPTAADQDNPSGQTLAGAGGVTDWQREDPFGDMPAPIGNPEAWPPNYADGYNDAVRNMVDAFPSVRARFTATSAGTTGDDSEDAARYRWLREPRNGVWIGPSNTFYCDKYADEAIDKEIAADAARRARGESA